MEQIEYLDYLDYVLNKLSENFESGLILSDLRYGYKKLSGIWIDSETQAHFEALYEYTYFVRVGTSFKHKILPETKSIINRYGTLSLYLKATESDVYEKTEIKHTTIHAQNVIYNEKSNNGNQSLSDNALDSPTIQTTNETIDKTPKRSWIELLSWIIGSIASIFAIYEFIIKRLFEDN